MVYMDIKLESIELIKELWEKNRAYHEETSAFFGSDYQSLCFEERMELFRALEAHLIKITLCKEAGAVIGYCISTAVNGVGEVASVHVAADKRGCGIGENLVKGHLAWMKEMACERIGVTVSQENASTIGFYDKLGFKPNTLYMQHLEK